MKKFINIPNDDVYNGAGSKGLFAKDKSQHSENKERIKILILELKKKQKKCTDRAEWEMLQRQMEELEAGIV